MQHVFRRFVMRMFAMPGRNTPPQSYVISSIKEKSYRKYIIALDRPISFVSMLRSMRYQGRWGN